jgi:hypothetical protein
MPSTFQLHLPNLEYVCIHQGHAPISVQTSHFTPPPSEDNISPLLFLALVLPLLFEYVLYPINYDFPFIYCLSSFFLSHFFPLFLLFSHFSPISSCRGGNISQFKYPPAQILYIFTQILNSLCRSLNRFQRAEDTCDFLYFASL